MNFTLFILDLSLHILDGVTRLHLEGDGLPGQGLHKDLHGHWSSTLQDIQYKTNHMRNEITTQENYNYAEPTLKESVLNMNGGVSLVTFISKEHSATLLLKHTSLIRPT